STPDPQAAFDLARTMQPDVIVLDADLAGAEELVDALMDDSATESCKIIVVGSFLQPSEAARYVAMGVARALQKPSTRQARRFLCEDVLDTNRHAPPKRILGEPTLAELGERLALEIRDALIASVDAAQRTRRIPLGEGAEVLAPIWGAIARVREIVTARTDGD